MPHHPAPSRLTRCVAAGIVALTLALAASLNLRTARADESDGTITLRVCNNSSRGVVVAVAYQPVTDNSIFLSEGWVPVASDTCETVANTKNAFSYFHAEADDGSGDTWGSGTGICVIVPGPYSLTVKNDGSECDEDEELRDFTKLGSSREPGTLTWNITD